MNAETMAPGLQDSLSGIFECSETPNGSVRVRTLLTHPRRRPGRSLPHPQG